MANMYITVLEILLIILLVNGGEYLATNVNEIYVFVHWLGWALMGIALGRREKL